MQIIYKKVMCFILLSISYPCLQAHKSSSCIEENNQTNFIFKRYYFVARLQRTIEILSTIASTLQTLNDHVEIIGRIVNFDHAPLFHHKAICRSIKRMQQTRSLKPLFMVWDDFSSYKSLEDEIFVEDFSKEIFIVTRNTALNIIEESIILKNIPLLQSCEEIENYSLEELLDKVDSITKLLEPCCNCTHKNFTALFPIKGRLHDLKHTVSTNEVAQRFYFIARLEPALALIESLKNTTYDIPQLKNDTISLELILDLWSDIKQYKFIEDHPIIQELITLSLIVLKSITSPEDTPLDYATHILDDTTNTEELLDILDKTVDQIIALSEKYELEKATSWSSWFKKIGIPLIGVATPIISQIVSYFKNT